DPKFTFPIRYDFKLDPPRIPSVPAMNIKVESKGRVELDVTVQHCYKCCQFNGQHGTRTTTEVKGFARGGMTITWGGTGNESWDNGWGYSYWYGIRGEISFQVQINSKAVEDSCDPTKQPGICVGYRALGRLSGGAQVRLTLGRWGVKTFEATINGELTQDGSICLNCASGSCSIEPHIGRTRARAYLRFCFGTACFSPCLAGDCNGGGDDAGT